MRNVFLLALAVVLSMVAVCTAAGEAALHGLPGHRLVADQGADHAAPRPRARGHLTERSELDAYRVMLRALDFGCLYHWYNDLTVVPTHPHLTTYMFPTTPIELGEGYLIGRERIVTKRSGLFGWGDSARHAVHVFDDQGREVPDFKSPTVVQDGRTFTELRLPEDYSAAILHR